MMTAMMTECYLHKSSGFVYCPSVLIIVFIVGGIKAINEINFDYTAAIHKT